LALDHRAAAATTTKAESIMKPLSLLVCALAALPALAAAQATSATWVNLRAGPDRDYPEVARVGPGMPLQIQGCTAGFGWCDVIAPNGQRGWVYAGNISYPVGADRNLTHL
jgi:uncharacterized protein YraI